MFYLESTIQTPKLLLRLSFCLPAAGQGSHRWLCKAGGGVSRYTTKSVALEILTFIGFETSVFFIVL